MKTATNITKWARVLNFKKEKPIKTVGLDLETVDNKLVLIGMDDDSGYTFTTDNFLNWFFEKLILLARSDKNIATWTRYDNTHLLKLLIENMESETDVYTFIEKAEKVSAQFDREEGYTSPPLYTFSYGTFKINVDMIVRNCILFRIIDRYGNDRTVWSYDIRNLFVGYNLLKASQDYGFNWYTKVSDDAHLIDLKRFRSDDEYFDKVIYSNSLDAKVVRLLADKVQWDFQEIFNTFPQNLISTGSLARSAIVAMSHKLGISLKNINIKSLIGNIDKLEIDYENKHLSKNFHVLDYSMRAYHGGKIDSYALGYFKNAEMIDITSAYPAVMRELKGFNKKQIHYRHGEPKHNDYNYIFVRCNLNVKVDSETLSTPFIISNPLNNASNINPYGYIKDIVLTKFEYQFVLDNLKYIDIEYLDHIYIVSDNEYLIYRPIIDELFNLRLHYREKGLISLENLVKTIINSLYGITYELNALYNDEIEKIGYKSGTYFNPIVASHITAGTRVAIAKMNNKIIKRGGKVLLNMTDSIIYTGCSTDDLTSDKKILGTFESADKLTDVLILGSGRYEYISKDKYHFRTRGFTAKTSDKSFYNDILEKGGIVENQSFITLYKATTKDYTWKDIGDIRKDRYSIDPFNLGGKRLIDSKDLEVDLSKNNITTQQVYLDEWLGREVMK